MTFQQFKQRVAKATDLNQLGTALIAFYDDIDESSKELTDSIDELVNKRASELQGKNVVGVIV